jgi:hypothetical protein
MWQLHQWQAMGYTLQGSSLAHKQYFNWKKSTMAFGFSMCASVCVGVRVLHTGLHTDTQHTAGTEKGRQQLRDRAAFLQGTMVKAPDAAQESESGCTLQ